MTSRAKVNLEYIDAKLKKFDLDAATKPFGETLKMQGFDRALTGTVKRASLLANDWLKDHGLPGGSGFQDYVKRKAAAIEDQRQGVAAFEKDNGTVGARSLYHTLRDTPEDQLRTYKDTRRAFRKSHWELTKEHAEELDKNIDSFWMKAKAWMQYRRKEIISAAAGLTLGALVTVPTHSYLDYTDKHRPISYKKYAIDIHPVTHMAIAANNLEMYLHDTWNNHHLSTLSSGGVVTEWNDFIKPGANSYNLRFTANDAGNDYTRPWGTLFETAKRETKTLIAPTNMPVITLNQGAGTVDQSWKHTEHDTTHTRYYECGDSKESRTCSEEVYDYTDHYWNLNRAQLAQGTRIIDVTRARFPLLPPAQFIKMLETRRDLPAYLLKQDAKTVKEAEQKLKLKNQWSTAKVLTNYNGMLQAVDALKVSGLPPQILHDVGSYPTYYHNRSYVHIPTSYPRGWDERNSLLGSTLAITEPHAAIHNTLGKYDTIIPHIQSDMDRLKGAHVLSNNTRSALRDLANTAYDLHNTSYGLRSWHPTYGMRISLEWLMFLGLAVGAGFGTHALLNRFADRGYERRYNAYS